jgi:hypothetical protein
MAVLRQFLYRDGDLVREFLSQIEGGLFDEESRTRKVGGTSGRSARTRGVLQESDERGQEEEQHSEEVELVVRQTEASEFDRLFGELTSEEAVTYLDAADEVVWASLGRGELVELEAVIQPAGFDKLIELMAAAQQLIPLVEAMGGEGLDNATKELIESVGQLQSAGMPEAVTVIASLAGAPGYRFACTLRSRYIVSDADLLEGEATLFGKIQRKLRPGEQHLVATLFAGLENLLPAEQQHEMVKALQNPESRQLRLASPLLEHPAAFITPIAIYR